MVYSSTCRIKSERMTIFALPLFNNSKQAYLTLRERKGSEACRQVKTSVSYVIPILTNFTGYTAFSLRRIEDRSGNTWLLLVQHGGCSW